MPLGQLLVLSVFVAAIYIGGPDGIPGTWIWPGPNPTFTVTWRVNQSMEHLSVSSVSLRLFASAFQSK